ncbi:hypothetical protein, partial [Bifidobacterium thermophilum]|uniref:hypothetical protein n=1 Tax=Bifidobacterium thermophilum TaxID=33905 RepID=UPI00197C644B
PIRQAQQEHVFQKSQAGTPIMPRAQKSPRDTPYGSRDEWQNKTHILSFNPQNQCRERPCDIVTVLEKPVS